MAGFVMTAADYYRQGGGAPAVSSKVHRPIEAQPSRGGPQAYETYTDLGDMGAGALSEFLRGGRNAAGAIVNSRTILRNPTVTRCLNLISNAIGMLPLHLMEEGHNSGERRKATDHALSDVLSSRPNNWQTAFVYRRLMQHWLLVEGNAYSRIVWSGSRVSDLIPLHPKRVKVEQRDDWSMKYTYSRKDGRQVDIAPKDMFHLLGPSEDGIKGLALVDFAADALGLALSAQESAGRSFSGGMSAGGLLSVKGKLGDEGRERLKADMQEQFTGVANAGKWIVGEEGMEAKPFTTSAKDNQNIETRKHQVEEIGRIFGVPRPFLMVDDTSWGSGIEQLGIFFVQYGLAPWFACWEQGIERSMLSAAERRTHYVKFNERALLRGALKDQAEFFAKALGSGGGRAWMSQDEVRELQELSPRGGLAGDLGMAATDSTGVTE